MRRNVSLLGALAAALALAVPSAIAVPGDREVSVGSPPSPFSAEQAERAGGGDGREQPSSSSPRDPTTTSTWRPATPATPPPAPSRRAWAARGSTSRSTAGRLGFSRRTPASRPRHCPGRRRRVPPQSARSGRCRGTSRTASSPTATRRSPSARARGHGGFSWANGSRLYYANLTSNVHGEGRDVQGLRGHRRLADRRPAVAATGGGAGKAAWMHPVIASASRTPRRSRTRSRSGPTTRPRAPSSATSTCAGRTSVGSPIPAAAGRRRLRVTAATPGRSSTVPGTQRPPQGIGPVRLHDPHGLARRRLRLLRAVQNRRRSACRRRDALPREVIRRR